MRKKLRPKRKKTKLLPQYVCWFSFHHLLRYFPLTFCFFFSSSVFIAIVVDFQCLVFFLFFFFKFDTPTKWNDRVKWKPIEKRMKQEYNVCTFHQKELFIASSTLTEHLHMYVLCIHKRVKWASNQLTRKKKDNHANDESEQKMKKKNHTRTELHLIMANDVCVLLNRIYKANL